MRNQKSCIIDRTSRARFWRFAPNRSTQTPWPVSKARRPPAWWTDWNPPSGNCGTWLESDRGQSLFTNSILFCWQFTIKAWWISQLFLTVIWNLHVLCNTPDSGLVFLMFRRQHTRRGWGPLKGAVSTHKPFQGSQTKTHNQGLCQLFLTVPWDLYLCLVLVICSSKKLCVSMCPCISDFLEATYEVRWRAL